MGFCVLIFRTLTINIRPCDILGGPLHSRFTSILSRIILKAAFSVDMTPLNIRSSVYRISFFTFHLSLFTFTKEHIRQCYCSHNTNRRPQVSIAWRVYLMLMFRNKRREAVNGISRFETGNLIAPRMNGSVGWSSCRPSSACSTARKASSALWGGFPHESRIASEDAAIQPLDAVHQHSHRARSTENRTMATSIATAQGMIRTAV